MTKLLGDFFELLKPGGRLLITTPNYRGTWPVVEWLTDHLGSAAHMDEDQHVTHFHRAMLREFLEAAGFQVELLTTYSTFAPFTAAVSWKFAAWLDRAERGLPFGNLLVAVARRP